MTGLLPYVLGLSLVAAAATHLARGALLRRELVARGRPVASLLAHLPRRARLSAVLGDLANPAAMLAAGFAIMVPGPVAYVAAAAVALALAVRSAVAIADDADLYAGILYAPVERDVVAEEARRYLKALRSALADDRLALLAWDAEERIVIAEGGLYDATDATPPPIGADARALFREWGPVAFAAFRDVAAGRRPDAYVVSTPDHMAAAGGPRRYTVRPRPNETPGAGYAFVLDSTDEPAEARAARERAESRAEAAEKKLARERDKNRALRQLQSAERTLSLALSDAVPDPDAVD